jgi:hypothetical protein
MRALSFLTAFAFAAPVAAPPSAAQGIKFDGPKFNAPQIAADMARLKITKDDLDAMFGTIDGITRWPDGKANVNLTIGEGFDPGCGQKLNEQLDASIADLHKRSGTRFERTTPDKADAIIEISDVPLLDKYYKAATLKPGAQISYKAPRNTSAVRWDMATVWNPQKFEMMAGWAYEGIYFTANRTRPGITVACQPFPMTWWLVHISKPHDRPLLNYMIPKDYSFPDAQLYDIMNFSIMNAEGVKAGMKGKDLVEALKAALP